MKEKGISRRKAVYLIGGHRRVEGVSFYVYEEAPTGFRERRSERDWTTRGGKGVGRKPKDTEEPNTSGEMTYVPRRKDR